MWRQQARWHQRQAKKLAQVQGGSPSGSGGQGSEAHPQRGGSGARGSSRGRGRGRGRGGTAMKPREKDLAKPWIDMGLQMQIHKLDSLLVKAKQSRQAAEMEQYQLQRDKVQSIEESKRMAYFAAHPDEEEFWLPRLAVEAGRTPQYCEMCELTFDSAQALSQHEREHETCGLEGCTFTAGPEQLETHILDLHASGLYGRMCRGQSQEEIDTWRAERKKAWPTHARTLQEEAKKAESQRRVAERDQRYKDEQAIIDEWVQKRQREMEERRKEIALIRQRKGGESSSEMMGQPRDGPKNKRQRRHGPKTSAQKEKFKPEHRIRVQKTTLKLAESDDSDDENWCSGVPMFRGTANLRTLSEATLTVMEANENISRTIGSPMRVSDHEEPDDNDPPSEEPIKKQEHHDLAKDPDEAPNSVEEALAMNPPKKIPNSGASLPRVQRVNRPMNLARVLFPKLTRFSAPKRPSTLLQNLLTKEIREERSELLQCVRFVCQREFFAQEK